MLLVLHRTTIADYYCSLHPFPIIVVCLSTMVAQQNDPNNCCHAHCLPGLSSLIARSPNRYSMDFDMEIDIVGFDIDFGIGFDTGLGMCRCFVAEQLEHL